MKEHPGPSFLLKHFKCSCGIVTQQHWVQLLRKNPGAFGAPPTGLWRCTCDACKGISVWQETAGKIGVAQRVGDGVPLTPMLLGTGPHADMPAPVRAVYQEAQRISPASPRAAAALLRVATELLCDALLGEPDARSLKLDQKIAKLVERGLPAKCQKGLDALRVIGNNAVHPGQIDFAEAADTAGKLFTMLNVLVEQLITQPKVIDSVFIQHVSPGQQEQIRKRDGDKKK